MELDPQEVTRVSNRLRRANGQLVAVIRMIDEGTSCEDVMLQLSAVSRALDKSGFAIIAVNMRQCLTPAAGAGAGSTRDVARLERLLLSMA